MKSYFVSNSSNQHLQDEETQWAEILSKGNPYAGILLIWDQKLCAVAHEFGAAVKVGAINNSKIEFYFDALHRRLKKVINLLEDSELQCQRSFMELSDYFDNLKEKEMSPSEYINSLNDLPEKCHRLSHMLCDELYQKIVKK